MKNLKLMPTPPALPVLEVDSELMEFTARMQALDDWKARIIARIIELEKTWNRPPPEPEHLKRDALLEQARARVAAPPVGDFPSPSTLPALLAEHSVLKRAEEFATQESIQVSDRALHRLREKWTPSRNEIVRELALAVAAVRRAQNRLRQLDARLCSGPLCWMPLPFQWQIGIDGGDAESLDEPLAWAVEAGIVTRKEIA